VKILQGKISAHTTVSASVGVILSKKITVSNCLVSATVKTAIEKAGGSVSLVKIVN